MFSFFQNKSEITFYGIRTQTEIQAKSLCWNVISTEECLAQYRAKRFYRKLTPLITANLINNDERKYER